jgi:hypothetical protein
VNIKFALCLLLFQSCQCKPPPVIPTESVLQVTPRELQFGQVFLGDTKVLQIEISKAGKSPIEVQIESTIPFASIKSISLQGGSVESIDVTFAPSETGDVSSKLKVFTLSESIEVTVQGNGKPVPICAVEPCASWTFSYSTGQCEKTVKPDSTNCISACNSPGQCVSGECLSESAPSCNDNNLCTSDFCGGDGGCFHRERNCSITSACNAAICDPTTGCGQLPLEDGTLCGAQTCRDAKVCINGTCDTRTKPNSDAECAYKDLRTYLSRTCAITQNDALRCWGHNRSDLLHRGYEAAAVSPGKLDLGIVPSGFTNRVNLFVLASDKTAHAPSFDGGVFSPSGTFQHYFRFGSAAGIFADGGMFHDWDRFADAGFLNFGPAIDFDQFGGTTCGLLANRDIVCWGEIPLAFLNDGGTSKIARIEGPFQQVRVAGNCVYALTPSGQILPLGLSNANGGYCARQISPVVPWTAFSVDRRMVGLRVDGVAENCELTTAIGGAFVWSCTPLNTSTQFVKLSTSNNHACGLATNGKVFCWGDNVSEELGQTLYPFGATRGSLSDISFYDEGRNYVTRANVVFIDGRDAGLNVALPIEDFRNSGYIAAGRAFMFDATGTLTEVQPGLLRDFTHFTNQGCPVSASRGVFRQTAFGALCRIDSLAAGIEVDLLDHRDNTDMSRAFNCVIFRDGGVSCGGRSRGTGRLGFLSDGGDFSTDYPSTHLNLLSSSRLRLGGNGGCVLAANRTVWCWGSFAGMPLPKQVQGLQFPTLQLECASEHCCARSGINRVQCWGSNYARNLGYDGPGSLTPKSIAIDAPVLRITPQANCAILTNGETRCWGPSPLTLGVTQSEVPLEVIQ